MVTLYVLKSIILKRIIIISLCAVLMYMDAINMHKYIYIILYEIKRLHWFGWKKKKKKKNEKKKQKNENNLPPKKKRLKKTLKTSTPKKPPLVFPPSY